MRSRSSATLPGGGRGATALPCVSAGRLALSCGLPCHRYAGRCEAPELHLVFCFPLGFGPYTQWPFWVVFSSAYGFFGSRFGFFGSFLTSLYRFFGSLTPDGMNDRPVSHVDRRLRQTRLGASGLDILDP